MGQTCCSFRDERAFICSGGGGFRRFGRGGCLCLSFTSAQPPASIHSHGYISSTVTGGLCPSLRLRVNSDSSAWLADFFYLTHARTQGATGAGEVLGDTTDDGHYLRAVAKHTKYGPDING